MSSASETAVVVVEQPGLGLADRPYIPAAALAVAFTAFTVLIAAVANLPLRDPDGVAGSAVVRLSAIIALFALLDLIPRAVVAARREHLGLAAALTAQVRSRWTLRRAGIVLLGLSSFYLTYVSYRNLKSFLPLLREDRADAALLDLDRWLAFGTDPAQLLHAALGTGIAAQVLSVAYLFFLVFIPISVAAALVWTRDVRRGYWYVTALGVNWVLGTASYYLLPSLGPVYVDPSVFADLPSTGVSALQAALLDQRVEVLAGPDSTGQLQSIAGFASLHVSIAFTAAAIGSLSGVRVLLRRSLWGFFVLTMIATIYFGWHYVVDDVAALAIGAIAVWAGAAATGHDLRALLRHRYGAAGRRLTAPASVNLPNTLTLGRILLVPPLVVLLVNAPDGSTAGAILFGACALSDVADGYLARSRDQVTIFGRLLDPVADKLLVGAALISLVAADRLAVWVPVVIVSRELLVTASRMTVARRGVVLSARPLGKAKMALQVAMILALIVAPDPHAPWMDAFVLVTVAATIASGVDFAADLRRSAPLRRCSPAAGSRHDNAR